MFDNVAEGARQWKLENGLSNITKHIKVYNKIFSTRLTLGLRHLVRKITETVISSTTYTHFYPFN